MTTPTPAQVVLQTIEEFGPMTDDALVRMILALTSELSPTKIVRIRRGLVTDGHVRDSGREAVFSSGRRARKWEAAR